MKRVIAIVLAAMCGAAHAGEAAYTVRPSELKAKPFSDAASVGNLPERSKVEVLSRQASWTQVKTDNATGWVKMLNLRFDNGEAPKQSGDSGI
ncbi:MAG TPA: SH3 domain-containing protein, partial [Burkholderiaceae bacterium]